MWGLVELSWLSGRGESEGSPDPTVCDEESEKIEVGHEERNGVGESCGDEDVAGEAENENGIASDGGRDWDSSTDLDGGNGEGGRDMVMNKDGVGAEEGASVGEAEVDSDADTPMLSDTVVVIAVSSSALVVGAAAVVVVDCPLLWPLSLDLSLDLSLGLLVPTGRRDTWISPFASTPASSPLPSVSPLTFSSPLLLSSPLYFLPLPLPLPLVRRCDVVVASGRTQACVSTLTPAADGTAPAELEGVKMCHSEFSKLLLLSAIVGLSEASKVEPRRVDVSSPAGVESSLVAAVNHERPHENKPAEVRKQRKITGGIRRPEDSVRDNAAKNKAESGFSLHRQMFRLCH